MTRWILPVSLALLGAACDDGDPPSGDPMPDATLDAALPDAMAMDAAALDMARDAAPPDMTPDAMDRMLDMAPDAAPDAYVPAPPGDEIRGEGDRLPNQATPVGASVTWALPPADPALTALQVRAVIWRWNDGEVRVRIDDGPEVPAMIFGDADAPWRFVRARDGAPPAGLPPPIEVPVDARSVQIIADGGPIQLAGMRRADPQDEPPPPDDIGTYAPDESVIVAPCVDDGCDDGALLSQRIAEAPADGTLQLRLQGRYHLRTPIRIARDGVILRGEDATLVWDPDAENHRGAIDVAGGGPQGPRLPIEGAVTNGQYRFIVSPPPDWNPRWVRIVADDFGGIPEVCINGRDQEQTNRHISQLAAPLVITPLDDGRVEVWTDRPLFLDVPAEANPGLQAVELRRDVYLVDLDLETNCPEAFENTRFDRVACTNPAVIEDDGVRFTWTHNARAIRVNARGTGKFAINATHALQTRIFDCAMSHPSDYGEGGKGYGVHLIHASRSVVRRSQVTQARHGVVVDFGSSDSQVLDGTFSAMNQALIDVHGEASRDTLIRGNYMHDAGLGVIVGGGGGFAHCNDGPRQYVHNNRTERMANAAMTAFFETRDVFVLQNDFDATLFGAVVGFDAEALLEGNIIRRARVGIQAADGGRAVLRDNVFTDACDEDAASLNARGEIVFEAGNRFCP